MYARRKFRHLTGTRTEAELLGELWTCRTILLQGTPDSLDSVQILYRRIGGLPNKAALRFCYEGRSVLLHAERALCVSINYYNAARSLHLELEVCVMWFVLVGHDNHYGRGRYRRLTPRFGSCPETRRPLQV